jgi:hypothetical protein
MNYFSVLLIFAAARFFVQILGYVGKMLNKPEGRDVSRAGKHAFFRANSGSVQGPRLFADWNAFCVEKITESCALI